MKLNKPNSLKINIDKYDSIKNFELYFFSYLKTIIKDKRQSNIVIYTLNQDIDILNHISLNIIQKLEKLDKYLNEYSIVIKFINFPYCIIRNNEIIEKYFINKIFENFEDIMPKKDIECLKCKYYVSCSGIRTDIFSPKSFDCELISKEKYMNKLDNIIIFFKNIGIDKKNVCFDLKHDKWNFNSISKSIVNRMIIDINSKNINYDNFFINIENYREQHRVNLIFKNYIINKRFNLLLKNEGISTYIRFISFKGNKYRKFKYKNKEFKYGILNLEGQGKNKIFDYINENIPFIKKHNIGDSFVGRSYVDITMKPVNLKVILLDNINNINKNFEDYIVLFNDRHLNNYIPHIYKFKYFLTYNNDVLNSNIAHFQIIFKEIGALCIDSISTDSFFGLEDNNLLEVNFNTGLIKRVG